MTTIKVVSIGVLALLAQGTGTGDGIVGVGEAVGKLGLIGLLIWIVWQQQKRIDDMTKKIEEVMEASIKNSADSRVVLEGIKQEVGTMNEKVDKLLDAVKERRP